MFFKLYRLVIIIFKILYFGGDFTHFPLFCMKITYFAQILIFLQMVEIILFSNKYNYFY